MSKTNNNQFCLFIILISSHLRIGGISYFLHRLYCWSPDFLNLLEASLPVCPVHCGLTRLQGPRGRRMEERRRRRRRRCRRRRWRRRLGKRSISTTLPTLSFPFTNCVKDKPGRGMAAAENSADLFIQNCNNCCCTAAVHNQLNMQI